MWGILKLDECGPCCRHGGAWRPRVSLALERLETAGLFVHMTLSRIMADKQPAGVVVRRFRPSDLQHIMPIENASFPLDAFPEPQLRRLSTAHPDEFLVAEMSGAVVGYVAGSVTGDCGQIESVAVEQRLRGRGIGMALIRHLLDRFQRIGLRKCALQVRTTNARAIDLYKRLGFHIVRTLVRYYPDGADALLMQATLPPRPP